MADDQHPPVVLIHGTFGLTSWGILETALASRGYCLFPFAYGNAGTQELSRSAAALASFVEDVLARMGTNRVSLIGHSAGGLIARYYVKFLGGSAKVEDLIGLSPSNHGTINLPVLPAVAPGCRACLEQRSRSPFLVDLNDGEEAPPPVDYTVVQTRYDFVVVPYTSAFLSGPGDRVVNITLQDRCPRHWVDHITIPSDPVAIQWVENALQRSGPADPGAAVSC